MKRPRPGSGSVFVAASLLTAVHAHALPVIRPPVLAVVNNPDSPASAPAFVPVSITGSDFGEAASTSKLNVLDGTSVNTPYSITSTTTCATPTSVDCIVAWFPDRVVAKLRPALTHAVLNVDLGNGAISATVAADRYDYNYYSTGTTSPAPLAMVNDGIQGYLMHEFDRDFRTFDLETGEVSLASSAYDDSTHCIQDKCWSSAKDWNENGIPDDEVNLSEGGESVIVDDTGRIWFSQGGGPVEGLTTNHSRIISYDPNAGPNVNPYRVYKVPGDNNQVWGLAWDKSRQRIWFASAGRADGRICNPTRILPTRLVSFRPDEFDCDADDPPLSPVCDPAVKFNVLDLPCDGGVLEWNDDPEDDLPSHVSGIEGECSYDPDRPCFTNADCVLADTVCESEEDTGCFHEYDLALDTVGVCAKPYGAVFIGHLAVSSIDNAVWFTSYFGTDIGNRVFVGRYDPSEEDLNLRERHFPLHTSKCGDEIVGPGEVCDDGNTDDDDGCTNVCDTDPPGIRIFHGTWEIIETANGDMAFTLDESNAVGRFNMRRVDDPACLDLTSATTDCSLGGDPDLTCHNPCVDMLSPPGFSPGEPFMHSVAEDPKGNVWFTQYGTPTDPLDAITLGFWKADRSGMSLFPTFSLYADSGTKCGEAPNPYYYGFSGSGITVNRKNGEVWFTDFCRRRIGRVRKTSEVCE